MKTYKSMPLDDLRDIICKHCGQRYGIHMAGNDACPDKDDFYRTHNTNTTFEPIN